jgi:hypothetical protein
MDDQRQEQEVIGNDQEVEKSFDELYLVPIYYY